MELIIRALNAPASSAQNKRAGIVLSAHICDFSKTFLVCRVSQDVTAVCGDHCALQRHSVRSHQRSRPLQPPVTVFRLQPPAGGGSKAAMTTPAHIWTAAVAPFMGHGFFFFVPFHVWTKGNASRFLLFEIIR